MEQSSASSRAWAAGGQGRAGRGGRAGAGGETTGPENPTSGDDMARLSGGSPAGMRPACTTMTFRAGMRCASGMRRRYSMLVVDRELAKCLCSLWDEGEIVQGCSDFSFKCRVTKSMDIGRTYPESPPPPRSHHHQVYHNQCQPPPRTHTDRQTDTAIAHAQTDTRNHHHDRLPRR